MKYLNILFLQLLFSITIYSQANFSVPDTICMDDSVVITNQSGSAQTYYWNFCSGDLSANPQTDNIGNPGGMLNGPAFISVIKAPEGFYAFITNFNDGSIVRLFFGTSLQNNPVAFNLGNPGGQIPAQPEGIQVKYDNGNYYGFVVGGQNPNFSLTRINFGNSLANNSPSASNLGNPGQLDYPMDLFITNDGARWIGFSVNRNSNTITQFQFGSSLGNNPAGSNLGNIGGLNWPLGIIPIKRDGNWYIFVSNYIGNSIIRLDFGTSLTNTPTGNNLSNPLLDRPIDLTLIYDCEKVFGYVLNSYGMAIRLNFDTAIYNTPQYVTTGLTAGFDNPHGISEVFRMNDTLFVLVANSANSTISRLYYPPCNQSSILSATTREAPHYKYLSPGEYNITLQLDEQLPTESFYCRHVVVLPNPRFKLGSDTIVCPGYSLTLTGPDSMKQYLWSDNSTLQTIKIPESNLYWLEVTDSLGCIYRDSINTFLYNKTLELGPDRNLAYGSPVTLDAGNNYQKYQWSTGETTSQLIVSKDGMYSVTITDENNCEQSDSIKITYFMDVPNFITPDGNGINDRWFIPMLSNFPNADIKIYDRYGTLVAAYKGSSLGWDGTCNGRPLGADAYWYSIDLHNGEKVFKGCVSIIR